jgi:hypothetical protein
MQYKSRFWILAVLLPLMWCSFVYSGFTSNYTGGVFTRAEFVARYQGPEGISRYRVLGPFLMLRIVDALDHLEQKLPIHAWGRNILAANRPFEYHVYEGYVILNTGALVLWSILFGLYLRKILSPRSELADLILIAVQAVIALTSFTVTPYDHLSYLFITLLFCGFVSQYPAWLLVVITLLGTLTRESMALAVLGCGAYATLPSLLHSSPLRWRFWLIGASFIGTYLGLRLVFGFGGALVENGMLGVNFGRADFLSLIGIAFGLTVALLPSLFVGFSARQRFFLVGALPYWVVILVSGVWFEVRLYVPLLLGSLLIAVTEWSQRAPAQFEGSASRSAG